MSNRFFAAYKCRSNDILPFLPGVFRLDSENRLQCTVVFSVDVLKSYFPDYRIIRYSGPVALSFCGRQVDNAVREGLLAILPDNVAAPMPLFSVHFDNSPLKVTGDGLYFVDCFREAVISHGFDSNFAVRKFVLLLFREYFLCLSPTLFVDPAARPTLLYLSVMPARGDNGSFTIPPFVKPVSHHETYVSVRSRLQNLVPFFQESASRKEIKDKMVAKGLKSLALRGFWCQLFLAAKSSNPQVTYSQLRLFALKVFSLLCLYTKFLPLVKQDGLYKRLVRDAVEAPKGAMVFRRTNVFIAHDRYPKVLSVNTDFEALAVGTAEKRPAVPGIF